MKSVPDSLAAIILAAGEGRRFGKPKYQAEYQGRTFLEIVSEKLKASGFKNIICVKQKQFEVSNKELLCIDNPTPESGMISSLYYALQSYPNYKGYLVFPVDHPFVELSTIESLRDAFNPENFLIIRPVFNDLPGHPVIIPNIFSLLKASEYNGGLRQLLKDKAVPSLDITVNDANILRNINYGVLG